MVPSLLCKRNEGKKKTCVSSIPGNIQTAPAGDSQAPTLTCVLYQLPRQCLHSPGMGCTDIFVQVALLIVYKDSDSGNEFGSPSWQQCFLPILSDNLFKSISCLPWQCVMLTEGFPVAFWFLSKLFLKEQLLFCFFIA